MNVDTDPDKNDDLEEGKPREEALQKEDSPSPLSEAKSGGLSDNERPDAEVPAASSDEPVSEVESEETESEESDAEDPENEVPDEALEEKQDTDAAESGENAEDEATEEAPVKPKPKPKWLELEPEDKTDPVPHLLKKYTERDDSWAFVAASVRGKLHAHKAMWREDSFAFDWTAHGRSWWSPTGRVRAVCRALVQAKLANIRLLPSRPCSTVSSLNRSTRNIRPRLT